MSTATRSRETSTAAGEPGRRRPFRASSETPAGPFTYIILVITLLLAIFPLYWMLVVGSSTDEELAKMPPNVIPSNRLDDNFADIFADPSVRFLESLWNTFLVSSIVTVSVVFFCSLAGFAFAKLRFWGRDVLLVLVVLTLTVPNQLGVVALYILMGKLGWNGELQAVTVPGLVTAFGVFYMRQYIFDAVPDELIEAARIDGSSTLRMYASVILPTIGPAISVLGLLTFTATWNEFQWPLITLGGSENPTVQVALNTLASGQFVVYSRVLAGALLATLPLLIVFVIAGKQIVGGIMEGAVKS
ncbi:MAG TPA: carbohydrate ABC transporter permease [Propionibacteriaceae bacterium]|jgi:cellobiose transport system permease protein